MKRVLRQLTISSVAFAALTQGQGSPPPAEETIAPVQLERLKPDTRNRVSLSYRMGLNITADFNRLGGLGALSNPDLHADPNFGGNTVRTYDQGGYVGIDVTGNDHGPGFENTTWFWGYGNAGAVQGNNLVLNSSSSPGNISSEDNSNDPQHGLELTYSREFFQNGNWRFGLDTGLGYARLSISDRRNLRGRVNRTTDSFSIPATVTLPPAPYAGTFDGPGVVIGSVPSSRTTSVLSEGALITGRRSLEADVFSLRIGPYAEVPLNDRWSLMFNGGLYLAMGDSEFSFQETVTIPDSGLVATRSGSGSQTDFLIGGYVGANIEYAISREVALFVGAQFQSAGRPANRENGKEAILNLDKSVIVSIGASYSF